MPQNTHVVKCYKCNTYQVDIVKKAKKWSCKMCGEKQSLIKVYRNGPSQYCRALVQHLNAVRINHCENDDLDEKTVETSFIQKDNENYFSKWEEFLPTNDQEDLNASQTLIQTQSLSKPNKNYDCKINKSHGTKNDFQQKGKHLANSDNEFNNYHVKKKPKFQTYSTNSMNQTKTIESNIQNDNISKWSEYLSENNAINKNKKCEDTASDNKKTKSIINKTNNMLKTFNDDINSIIDCIPSFNSDKNDIQSKTEYLGNSDKKIDNCYLKNKSNFEEPFQNSINETDESYTIQNDTSKWSEFLTNTPNINCNFTKHNVANENNLNYVHSKQTESENTCLSVTHKSKNDEDITLVYDEKNVNKDMKVNMEKINSRLETFNTDNDFFINPKLDTSLQNNVINIKKGNLCDNQKFPSGKLNNIFEKFEDDIDSILDF